MSAQDDKERTRRERIERLRGRLKLARRDNEPPHLVSVLAGILDLLADEGRT